jgi:ethanolamine ammonia-lyase small subunit
VYLPEGPGYPLKLHFERTADGGVKVSVADDASSTAIATCTSDEWACIVAEVSKYGGTVGNVMFAQQLHDGNIHSVELLDEKYRKVIGVDLSDRPLDEIENHE